MPAFREGPAGQVEIYAHRGRAVRLVLGLAVFTALGLWMIVLDPWLWTGWVTLLFFGGLGSLAMGRNLRRGVYTGPALVLSEDGLHDRQSGVRVRWDDVQRMEIRDLRVRGARHRFLGLWVADPTAVFAQFSKPVRALAKWQLQGWPPVNIGLTHLATTPEQEVELLRRFYAGELHVMLEPATPRFPWLRRVFRRRS